jgi:hypothetical protein
MSVGHGGDMSKHPAWVKVAILDFLQQRFSNQKVSMGKTISVFDPFNTDMDFFIYFNETTWEEYVGIYHNYYSTANSPETKELAEHIAIKYDDYATKHGYPPGDIYIMIKKALSEYSKPETNNEPINEYFGTFNASKSKTFILYSVQNMINILQEGHP